MIKYRFLALLPFLFFLASQAGPQTSRDYHNHVFKKFSSAKKAVFQADSERKTFYCGCPYNSHKKVDTETCGFHYRKSKKRAKRVEVEHVVPADKLCGKTPEWTHGSKACITKKGKRYRGRKCASKHNALCQMAYNDLHNLRPAIGEVNNDRSDYPFVEESAGYLKKVSPYGSCRFIIRKKTVTPPKNVRGDIARIYLYMNFAYPELHLLTEKKIEFFMRWSKMDPATKEECQKNDRIYRLQKTRNVFIDEQCKGN